MTDAELLERIERYEIHVCHQTLEVHYFHRQRKQWYKKSPDFHPKSGRARFRFGGKRRTVYRNRLVWMYFNRRIPDGNIDHKDGNRMNDHPLNLADHSKTESARQGAAVQKQLALKECCDYFDFIALFGEEPSNQMQTK